MKKILVSTSSYNLNNIDEISRFKAACIDIKLNPYSRKLTENEVEILLKDDVVGIIAGVEPLTSRVLLSAPKLKVISRCGIGLDNVDLTTAKQIGIQVFNATDGPVQAVAELTVGHILSLLRNITSADRSIRARCWKPQMGNLLSEKIVGVVGYGRIGRLVSRLCAGFGAKVIAYDAYVSTCESNVSLVSFETILKQSDILTLHLPIDEFSWHIIGESQLAQMKSSALLLNMSRGGLIDERALYSALKNGMIRGAALDCYEDEPYQGPMLDLENVQFTAHMGSYAREAREKMERQAADNLIRGLVTAGIL